MSKEETKEEKIVIATLEDLMGDASQKETTIFLESTKAYIRIRRLTIGDVAKVNAFSRKQGQEDDPFRQSIGLIVRGLVDPQLQYSEAEGLPASVATEIVTKISEFSGFTTETMEQARSLSEATMEST